MFRPPVEVSRLLSLEEDAGLVLLVEIGDVDISTSVDAADVADSETDIGDGVAVGDNGIAVGDDGVAVDDDGSAGASGLVPSSAAETVCPSARLDCWSSGLG